MLLVLNTKLSETKSLKTNLTMVYGLGRTRIKLLLRRLGFSGTAKVNMLSDSQVSKLQNTLTKMTFKINVDLKKYQQQFLDRLSEINLYKMIKKKLKTHTRKKKLKHIRKKSIRNVNKFYKTRRK